MSVQTLLIVGDDYFSSLLSRDAKNCYGDNLLICIDKSTNIRRVYNLIRKRRLSLGALMKIVIAEKLRAKTSSVFDMKIRSNEDLLHILTDYRPDRVLCYRCGLVINKAVIDLGFPVYNIHCSDLPAYPGIGTIERSIRDGAWSQNACLHLIDEGIDTGLVLKKMPYVMSREFSYKENEDLAYKAGLSLAHDFLARENC